MTARRPLVIIDSQVQELPAGDTVAGADGSGGGGYFPTLEGSLAIYATESTTLTITNYDSATTYSVSATGGTVTITGDQITYTAGLIAGTFAITVNDRSVAVTVGASYVKPPTVISPSNGQTEVTETPLLVCSNFETVGAADTQAYSQWQIRLATDTWETVLHDSGYSSTAKTSYPIPADVLEDGETQYVMHVRQIGINLGASEWSADVTFTTRQQFFQILGIVCVSTGGGGSGTWQRVEEDFSAMTTTTETFNGHPVYAGVVQQTIDGQAMVKVPKFYVKSGTVPSGPYAGKRYWMISDQPKTGYGVHPAFMSAGVEIGQFWCGKYQGSSDGGNKLCSVAGVMPQVSVSFTDFQTRANNRNVNGISGFGLWSFYQVAAIQLLALIEMGGTDSQALLGRGNVDGASALAVDNATVAQASWRGIVGLWGNIWQCVDGLVLDSLKYRIWDTSGNKTFKSTGVTAPVSGSFPITVSAAKGEGYDLSTVFLPDTGTGAYSDGTYADRFYANTWPCVTYMGGRWNEGNHAGLFSLSITDRAGDAFNSVGARLAKV